jgi:signal transduction histidine kinase
MPEITGIDLLEKAKQLKPLMTRILLTGYTEVESVIGAINRGSIYRYIAKPWDPEDLKISLHQAAEAYRLKKSIEEKNAALEKSNAELQKSLEELQRLDKAKDRCLSLVSHELNTPLTAVISFVALLEQSKAGFSQDMQRAIQSLGSASDRLGEIVQEVLDYVRLEAQSEWRKTPFDWEAETLLAIASLKPLCEKRRVSVVAPAKSGLVTLCAADKMRVVLHHLLREAISRASAGPLLLTIQKDKAQVRFHIDWKGEPIPETALEAFETGGKQEHHHRNLALGLATVKLVAERHGGQLHLTPSPPSATLILPAEGA